MKKNQKIRFCAAFGVAAICSMTGQFVAMASGESEPKQNDERGVESIVLSAGGEWSVKLRDAFIKESRAQMMVALKEAGEEVSPETVRWVDGSETARMAVYGAVYPGDYRIMLNLDQLRKELGAELFDRYSQFCVGAAIARRSVGVGPIANAPVNLKFAKIYEWGDQAREAGEDPAAWLANRKPKAKKDQGELFIKIRSYLKKNSLSVKDAYAHDAHRKAMLEMVRVAGEKKPERALPEVLRKVVLDEGLRPPTRSDYPSVSAYLKYLDRIGSIPADRLSLVDGQKWPLYPIRKSPWPMMMPLSMTWPLDESEYIWEKYQGEHGGKRFHTYGPYNRFPAGVGRSLEPSKWHWSSWPSTITTGGLCGTMSSIANGTCTALGVPIIKAGQPGHSCVVRYDVNSKGEYVASVGQSATGGPEKTTTPWLFGDSPSVRNRGKYVVYSEFHYGLAQAMNKGLDSYVDTRIALHIYKSLPASQKSGVGRPMLLSALEENPYNIQAWYVLAKDSRNGIELTDLLMRFDRWHRGPLKREENEDRDVTADLGQDKINPKQSVESKIATLKHIGIEKMAEIGLHDLRKFSKEDLQLLIRQLDQLIESGNGQLKPSRDRCRCGVDGEQVVQKEISTELHNFLSNPPRGRKNKKRKSSQILKRVVAVASVTKSRDQREEWLGELLAGFSPEQKVVVNKKKEKQLDKFYASVSDLLLRSLKSKPADKKSIRELKAEQAGLLNK